MLSRIGIKTRSPMPQSIIMAVHQLEGGCVRLIPMLQATKVSDFRYYRGSAIATHDFLNNKGKVSAFGLVCFGRMASSWQTGGSHLVCTTESAEFNFVQSSELLHCSFIIVFEFSKSCSNAV